LTLSDDYSTRGRRTVSAHRFYHFTMSWPPSSQYLDEDFEFFTKNDDDESSSMAKWA
jgi:hypothetical protein